MLAADCQTSNPYHIVLIIAMILMNGATIDLVTTFSSKDPKVRNGRGAFWPLSPLTWAFAMAYRKITGVAAPIWMPWTVAFVICATAMLVAHFLR